MTERVLSEVVELDIDKCQNTYGVAPCTAGAVESGTAQAGAASTLTLRAGASAVDNAYQNMTARLTGGAGSVQERTISGYVGASKVATVSRRWGSNLLVRSDEFDNASWNKVLGVTVNANAVAAPDGTMTADQIVFPGVTSGERIEQSPILAVDGVTYNETIWMKGSGQININIGTSTGVGGQTEPTITLTSEWQRVSATVTLSLPTGNVRCMGAIWRSGPVPTLYIWRAKLERGADIGLDADDLQTVASAIALPDATTTYTIIDRPNACTNRFRGCQDPANYVKGTQTIRFTGVGAPINPALPARPFITTIETAPTEIDPEEGLAQRAASSVAMVDAPDSDVDMDPYVLTRATRAGGTFWSRFFARNLNYVGRQARIKRAFATRSASGAWSFGTYTTQRYIIETAKGPDGRGEVRLTLKDPLKLTDRTKLPTPTAGKLLADVLISDLSFPLNPGDGANYTATGYVRIGDEVIRYDGNAGDVLSLSLSSYRAQFGTAAAEASADDTVQQCLVYIDQPFSTVIQDLLNRSGILDADIDLVQLVAEDDTWLGAEYKVTACITDPEDVSDLLMELLQQSNSVMWWSPTEQKLKFQVFAPQSPSMVSSVTLDDDQNLIEASVSVERMDDQRVSLVAINFGTVSATANIDEAKNYKLAEIAIDADAESANEYNERRPRTLYSRWFGAANTLAMRTLVRRYVARYRDAPERIEFRMDPKDGALVEGGLADLETYRIVDEFGVVKTVRVLITRREDTGRDIRYAARVTNFDENYGFIGPVGELDYPDNAGYFVIGDASGLLSDGTPCSKII